MQPGKIKAPRSKMNILMLAYVAFLMLGLPTGFLGVAWPTLRVEFALPLDAMGLLLFSSTAGYFLASFFIARLINRFGIGTLLIFSSLASALAAFGYSVAPDWGVIIAIGLFAGLGSGILDTGLNTYLAAEYKESEMQWLHACFGIGATLSPLIMTISLSQFTSWRPGFIFVGILMTLITGAFWFTYSAWKAPKKPSETNTEIGKDQPGLMDYRTSIWKSLLHPQTWLGILMFLLYTGVEFTLANWTYTLFTEGRGIDPQIAGIWAGGFWATFTVGRILGGLYTHRIRINTLMVGAMTLALVGAIIFWWNPLPLAGVLGVFLVGFAMAPVFPGLISSTSRRVGEHHAANTIGIQMSAATLGGALLPALAGFLARRISLEIIPVVLTVALLGLLVLYWLSIRVKEAEKNYLVNSKDAFMPNHPPAYRNPALSIEERVADLLGRMTLEEKIGQLIMWDARSDDLSFINTRQPGSILHILGENVRKAMQLAAQNRLGIPLLVGEDAIHGHSFWKGATIFPTQLALACSWNPALLERVGRVTAEEVAPTGIHWTFSPVLCLTRDLRWGRTGETFGEDPYLIGELAAAMISGYQGKGLLDPTAILATAKHYAGYSETQGGRDASKADLTRRKLRSYFLPPFERAVQASAMTFMTGYQSIDGVPSTCNHWLLTEVLKDEWGFKGVLVTDWNNVGRLVDEQKVCANYSEAAIAAIRAGNDIMMTTPQFYEGALDAVRSGSLSEAEIDVPCARFLALKFRMGLFENPRGPDLERAAIEIGRTDHRDANLKAARQSLVLLQNNGLLPLDSHQLKSIAVIGPNADDDVQQLGDWSLGSSQHPPEAGKHPREKTITILDGIRSLVPETLKVIHEYGCSIIDDDLSGIPAAVTAAEGADVVVVVVGDHLKFIGEERSTATLELQGGQVALLEALEKTGKPLVVVLVNSKPLVLPPAIKRAAAIIELFNPGMQGGQALAEALFGLLNPSGKLTVSFPLHVGQQPVFYNQVRGQHSDRYADLIQEPLFPFGHGLGYTKYSYSNLRSDSSSLAKGETAGVFVDVENIGKREGVEIVQLYVSDVVTSVTWVDKALKGFARVQLAPGEKKTVQIELPWQAFQIVNAEGVRVVEPGEFEILVGPSSRDCDLLRIKLNVN